MSNCYYLAYGSNLHPLRLTERLPQASLVAQVEIPHCQLRFHKRGQDGSGKCNLVPDREHHHSHGALYRIASQEAVLLDRWEEGYHRCPVEISLPDRQLSGYTYLADDNKIDNRLCPFDWYRSLVRVGMQYLKLPCEYLSQLERQQILFDEDPSRAQIHQTLLKQILDQPQKSARPALPIGRLSRWG